MPFLNRRTFGRHIFLTVAAVLWGGKIHARGVSEQKLISENSKADLIKNILEYGALGDGHTDCTKAIQNAIDDVHKSGGGTVRIPAGYFVYSDIIFVKDRVNLHALDGAVLTPNTQRQSITVTGRNVTLRGLNIFSNANSRITDSTGNAITVTETRNVCVENCVINGAWAAGIFIRSTTNFLVQGNTIAKTQADSIHVTGGSSEGTVKNNICIEGGDDGVAVVSYRRQNTVCNNIQIIANQISGGKARGVAVVGGENIQILLNNIVDTKWAGIYVASEESFDTYGSHNIIIKNNRLHHVNRVSDGGTHGCITVIGRPGSAIAVQGTVSLQNQFISLISNLIFGDGRDGIRINEYCSDVLVQENSIESTGGWGIACAAFDVQILKNKITAPAVGGIALGATCPGGTMQVDENSITLQKPSLIGIVLRSSRVEEVFVRHNFIYVSGTMVNAIRNEIPLARVRFDENIIRTNSD
ncbi:MAG TPA: right-handed parallel beta-helix repeat-containing protein [Alphaproteobacteria bacterium]|jgi:parallel beta-helix repeat protein